MNWIELEIKLEDGDRERVTSFLFDLGACGVDESDFLPPKTIRAYFNHLTQEQLKQQVSEFLGERVHTLKEVKEENWGEEYKKYFHAQRLSSEFYLIPAWEKDLPFPHYRIPIFMEPGQAFGTGLHPSTKLCVRLIERLIQYNPKLKQERFLDVGTGTGILSIVARKIGIENVTAVDIDPIAVEVAKDNLILNQTSGVTLIAGSLELLEPPYSAIVSNILYDTHVELASHYSRLLPRGGQIILSGLLTPQIKPLEAFFRERGFIRELMSSLQEWSAMVLTKTQLE